MLIKNFKGWLTESLAPAQLDAVKAKLERLGIWGGDLSSQSRCKGCKDEPQTREFFVTHHSATSGDALEVLNILNARGMGVNWIVDKKGKAWLARPFDKRGDHILDSDNSRVQDFNVTVNGKVLTNSNTEGVEVVGMSDAEVAANPAQIEATCQLIFALGYTPDKVANHGKINPGRKMPDEGLAIKNAYQTKYYEYLKAGDPNLLYGKEYPHRHSDNLYLPKKPDPNLPIKKN
jgi:hypothetical protein